MVANFTITTTGSVSNDTIERIVGQIENVVKNGHVNLNITIIENNIHQNNQTDQCGEACEQVTEAFIKTSNNN